MPLFSQLLDEVLHPIDVGEDIRIHFDHPHGHSHSISFQTTFTGLANSNRAHLPMSNLHLPTLNPHFSTRYRPTSFVREDKDVISNDNGIMRARRAQNAAIHTAFDNYTPIPNPEITTITATGHPGEGITGRVNPKVAILNTKPEDIELVSEEGASVDPLTDGKGGVAQLTEPFLPMTCRSVPNNSIGGTLQRCGRSTEVEWTGSNVAMKTVGDQCGDGYCRMGTDVCVETKKGLRGCISSADYWIAAANYTVDCEASTSNEVCLSYGITEQWMHRGIFWSAIGIGWLAIMFQRWASREEQMQRDFDMMVAEKQMRAAAKGWTELGVYKVPRKYMEKVEKIDRKRGLKEKKQEKVTRGKVKMLRKQERKRQKMLQKKGGELDQEMEDGDYEDFLEVGGEGKGHERAGDNRQPDVFDADAQVADVEMNYSDEQKRQDEMEKKMRQVDIWDTSFGYGIHDNGIWDLDQYYRRAKPKPKSVLAQAKGMLPKEAQLAGKNMAKNATNMARNIAQNIPEFSVPRSVSVASGNTKVKSPKSGGKSEKRAGQSPKRVAGKSPKGAGKSPNSKSKAGEKSAKASGKSPKGKAAESDQGYEDFLGTAAGKDKDVEEQAEAQKRDCGDTEPSAPGEGAQQGGEEAEKQAGERTAEETAQQDDDDGDEAYTGFGGENECDRPSKSGKPDNKDKNANGEVRKDSEGKGKSRKNSKGNSRKDIVKEKILEKEKSSKDKEHKKKRGKPTSAKFTEDCENPEYDDYDKKDKAKDKKGNGEKKSPPKFKKGDLRIKTLYKDLEGNLQKTFEKYHKLYEPLLTKNFQKQRKEDSKRAAMAEKVAKQLAAEKGLSEDLRDASKNLDGLGKGPIPGGKTASSGSQPASSTGKSRKGKQKGKSGKPTGPFGNGMSTTDSAGLSGDGGPSSDGTCGDYGFLGTAGAAADLGFLDNDAIYLNFLDGEGVGDG